MDMRVLIVGAGPAGLACAGAILSERPDSEVVIIDKKSRIGEPQRCAGGVSLYMMEKADVMIPDGAIVAPIKRVRIYSPNGDYWELKGDKAYGYVLDRIKFEQWMAKVVQDVGANIVLNCPLDSANDFLYFSKKYDFVVGADGPTSFVRKLVNLPKFDAHDIHLGVQKTITMDYYPQDTVELYFGEKVAPKGYAWIFPGGNGLVRIGLGVPLSQHVNTGRLLDSFIQRHIYEYDMISHIAKQIPTARMPKTGVFGRILLVGDALPSTDPLTGGGIVQAIASGKAAGKAIAEGNPQKYDRYISWLRKQNNRRYRLKNVLYSFRNEDFNDLIAVMRKFKPKTLSLGKELRRAAIHVLLRKPRLVRKFLKVIL